jgi:hypothetical protein
MRARVAWAHDGMSDPTLAAAFQTLPGASFIVNDVTPAKNSALTPPVPSFASPTASRCWPNSTASSLPLLRVRGRRHDSVRLVAGRVAETPALTRRVALMSEEGLLMTPRRTDTDGFYVSVLVRRR